MPPRPSSRRPAGTPRSRGAFRANVMRCTLISPTSGEVSWLRSREHRSTHASARVVKTMKPIGDQSRRARSRTLRPVDGVRSTHRIIDAAPKSAVRCTALFVDRSAVAELAKTARARTAIADRGTVVTSLRELLLAERQRERASRRASSSAALRHPANGLTPTVGRLPESADGQPADGQREDRARRFAEIEALIIGRERALRAAGPDHVDSGTDHLDPGMARPAARTAVSARRSRRSGRRLHSVG